MLNYLQTIDLALFDALTPWHTPWLDTLMSAISASGTAAAIWLVIATGGLAWRSTRAGAWRVYLTLLLCFVTVDLVLKPVIARSRPQSIRAYDRPRALPPVPRTLSFPSGHTASAFGGAIALARIWPRARVSFWVLAILMGYSRIYVGHHYPLDVLGGALIGTLVALWVLGGRHPATYCDTITSREGAVTLP